MKLMNDTSTTISHTLNGLSAASMCMMNIGAKEAYNSVPSATGSCLLLETRGGNVLVECGLIQGAPRDEARNAHRFPFDPGGVDAVLLTHAHVDHSGRLPKLVKDGYRGPIHCTDATGGTLGFCNGFFGTPASNNIPQTGTGPFSLPNLNFASTAGIGDFTSDVSVMTPQASVMTATTYVGKEVSRTFFAPEPTGLAMLLPGALLLVGLAHRGAARRRG